MKKSTLLRWISLGMLSVAIIFIACALGNPGLGQTFYIGNIEISVEVWRAFYAIYAIVMGVLFVASFFVDVTPGGFKASIVKLLLFIPVLIFAFIMGVVLILKFKRWLLLVFLALIYSIGHGVYYLFRKIDKKFGGA